MEHVGDSYTNCERCFWYSHQRIIKGTGGLGGVGFEGFSASRLPMWFLKVFSVEVTNVVFKVFYHVEDTNVVV